ncbi:PD-(D/E)XK nuclease-like domain-containing protein [Limibacter armeniacum]|uniref:PD-(D/E)XK nuclease-like domain-containing protein n=1 Tax=Limibacter armeniacum TaxID=466084 RepID=UPI002FE64479
MKAEIRILSDTEYRNHPAICNSDLSIARDILSGRVRKKPALALRIGSAVHMALLEPQVWQQERLKMKDDEVKRVDKLAAAVKRNSLFGPIIEDEEILKEVCLFWTDEETGTECKAKADLLQPDLLLGDVKTTAAQNKERFLMDAFRFDYDRQLAFYNSAVGAERLLLIGISKKSRGSVYFSEFDAESEFIQVGVAKYRALLKAVSDSPALRKEVYNLR